MSARSYYNEHDPFAAAWLRELIRDGRITPGDVDERDIQQVQPSDLRGYDRCHFFAGIGGWDYALQLAGWPADRPVWTGSCPCQPYSAAGKGEGADDARNLWPHWFRLIRECRPGVVFGEQVEAAIRHGWLDAVSTDLEAEGYAFGAAVLGAHSVGAPHIRQRVFFVADAEEQRTRDWQRGERSSGDAAEAGHRDEQPWNSLPSRALADAAHSHGRRRERSEEAGVGPDGIGRRGSSGGGVAGLLADPLPAGRAEGRAGTGSGQVAGSGGAARLVGNHSRSQGRRIGGDGSDERTTRATGVARGGVDDSASARLNGAREGSEGEARDEARLRGPECGRGGNPWSDLLWLPCRDGKARPTQPGIFPLAHGVPNRVGTLRGAGNAINPWTAAEVIGAYLDIRDTDEGL